MVIKTLSPTSAGSYQQNNVSSGSHVDAVSTIGGAYLYSNYRTWGYDTFVCSPAAIGNNAIITKVTLTARFYSNAECAGSAKLAVYFGGLLYTYDETNVDGGQTKTLVREFTVSPDGSSWLRSDLDSIEFGGGAYTYDTGGGKFDYVTVDVEYTPISGGQHRVIGMMM